MGRKKIKIQPIKEDRNRSVTYLKRKAGLFKKAHELAVLTDSQVAVIVFGHNGKLAEFCSTDIDLLLLRYTEYEGAAERKGPQHYLNLDKDSDDNDADDNDNDDNDNASGDGDGHDDDFPGPSGANGGAGPSGNSNGKFSGIKRKAEPASPPWKNKLALANGASPIQFGSANVTMGASPTAKQAVNAAIRRKSQGRSASIPAPNGHFANQHVFDPLSFNQSFLANPALPQHMIGGGLAPTMPMQSSSGLFSDNMTGQSNASVTNPTRAQQRASMSIPMPSNDRVGIFVTPSTPSFGITPGGTVTTPVGRRFSFSDVLTGGSQRTTNQRPVTANSLLAPTMFDQQQDAFGLSAASQATFISPSASPQPPPGGTMEQNLGLDASASPFPPNANLLTRPASTGVQRSVAPTYNEATYSTAQVPSVAGGNNLSSPANIFRPVTAFANLDAPSGSGHLAPPVTGFPGSLSPQAMHANSASPVPSVEVNATGALPTAFAGGPFASPDYKSSATPAGSQASSATPDLMQRRANGPSALGAGATSSSEEESPPSNGGKLDASAAGMQPWLGMDSKQAAQSTLVQPVPINASTFSFDLSFPTNPV